MTKLFLIAVSILLAVVIGRAAQMRIAGGGADAARADDVAHHAGTAARVQHRIRVPVLLLRAK